MPIVDIEDWIGEHSVNGKIWFVKRLSANDTGLTGGHQSGVLIAKEFLFALFPQLNDKSSSAPTVEFTMYVDSHAEAYADARAKWYWSKTEGRFTRIGGKGTAFLDPENTGTIVVLVFDVVATGSKRTCNAWVCEGNGTEADRIEEILGSVEPRQFVIWQPGAAATRFSLFANAERRGSANCSLSESEIPHEWKQIFPTGRQLIAKVAEMRPLANEDADNRLWKRRECEFELFKSVEQFHFMPKVAQGFRTLQDFIDTANSLLQSRRTRGGNSLEYHVHNILVEEGFTEDIDFSHNSNSEGRKKPDFIFPSASAYHDPNFPADKLKILACKTTCKDRWRQVLNEADRVEKKHLITLQEGLSVHQFSEMKRAGIELVVPRKLLTKFPDNVRREIRTLQEFLADLRTG